jgi:hypothetical protein
VAVNGCGKLDNPTSLARLAPYLLPTTAAGRSRTSVTGWSVFRRTANPYQISTERDARRHPRDPPISVGQRPIVNWSLRSPTVHDPGQRETGLLRQAIPRGPHGPVIA